MARPKAAAAGPSLLPCLLLLTTPTRHCWCHCGCCLPPLLLLLL
jgi:hypothetical protein